MVWSHCSRTMIVRLRSRHLVCALRVAVVPSRGGERTVVAAGGLGEPYPQIFGCVFLCVRRPSLLSYRCGTARRRGCLGICLPAQFIVGLHLRKADGCTNPAVVVDGTYVLDRPPDGIDAEHTEAQFPEGRGVRRGVVLRLGGSAFLAKP